MSASAKILRYAVEITIRGDQRLKEYTLGVDGPSGNYGLGGAGSRRLPNVSEFFDSIHVKEHGNFRMAPNARLCSMPHAHGILAAGQEDHPERMLGISSA